MTYKPRHAALARDKPAAEAAAPRTLAPRPILDDEWVSQCGQRKQEHPWNFRRKPRLDKDPPEQEVSMLLGRLSASDAELAAFGPYRPPDRRRAVRHSQAGTLRAAGFRVEHTPKLGTEDHVSVFWDGEGVWDERVGALLDACCSAGEVS